METFFPSHFSRLSKAGSHVRRKRRCKQNEIHMVLKLNDNKTQFVLIGSRQQLNKVRLDHITIGNASIYVVTSVRSLRAHFDSNPGIIDHINAICKSCFYHLHNIWCIRKFLSLDSAKALVKSVNMAQIDYCNSLLVGVPNVHLSKLQRLQNVGVRMVTLSPI